MVSVRVTQPARSRLSDVYLHKPFNRSRFYAFLSNGSESGNFQTKTVLRPSSHSKSSESLVFAFITTQRESVKASRPVVKDSLTETLWVRRAASSADFAEVFLWKVAQFWAMKREELREVKGRHRWLTLLLTCWFLTHFQFYSPISFFGPRFCFHYDCCLEGKFPLKNLQIFSSLFWKNFDTLFISRVHAVWWFDAGCAAGNSPSAVIDYASCLI